MREWSPIPEYHRDITTVLGLGFPQVRFLPFDYVA